VKRSQPRGGSARTALLSFVIVAGIAVAAIVGAAGCSSDGGTCTPGKQSTCGCPDGTKSSQVCKDDGSGFGPCLACPTTRGGSSGCASYCDMCLSQVNCTAECQDQGNCGGAWDAVAACANAEGCGSVTCASANEALAQCLGSTGTSATGPSTGSGGEQKLSCDAHQGGTEFCFEELHLSASDASTFEQTCNMQIHGSIGAQCPTQGLVGCCTSTSSGVTSVACYYSGSETSNQQSCQSNNGSWSHAP
jgi:hypothetical protein